MVKGVHTYKTDKAFSRSSPSRVGDFDMILDRLKHASKNLQTQVLLIM